jgi:hypothetical protein
MDALLAAQGQSSGSDVTASSRLMSHGAMARRRRRPP